MLWGKRSKIANSIALGLVLGSTNLWAEKASAQSLFDLIKMPFNLIEDRLPTQLPNTNTRAFDSNLNNNTINFCMFPCLPGNFASGTPMTVPNHVAPQVAPQSVPISPIRVSPPTGIPVVPNGVSTPGISASPNGVAVPGVSASPNGVSAPGISASPNGVSTPEVSASPNGVSVAPSAMPQGGALVPNSSLGESNPNIAIPPISLPIDLPKLF